MCFITGEVHTHFRHQRRRFALIAIGMHFVASHSFPLNPIDEPKGRRPSREGAPELRRYDNGEQTANATKNRIPVADP